MAVLPTPMMSTFSPTEVVWPKAMDSSQSMPMWMRSVSWRPGMSRSLPRGAPVPTKMASKPAPEKRLHAFDGGVVANVDAHVEDLVDLFVENVGRQAEGRDVGAHQAAGLVVLFEHDDFVAERQQVVGDGEGSGAGADAGDALAVFLGRNFREPVLEFAAQVGCDALEAADGHRFAVHAGAAAGRLARPIASAAENGGEHVRFPVEHVGVGVAALRDHPYIFRDIGVGRTSPLAIDNFMVVVRIPNVGRGHASVLSNMGEDRRVV